MELRDELVAYQARRELVDKRIWDERRDTSIELRWRQLNAAYALGKALGLDQKDQNDAGVSDTWVRLKTQISTK